MSGGEIPVVIGPALSFSVPADWPERSRRFWDGVEALMRPATGRPTR
jgi:hypothetical protein